MLKIPTGEAFLLPLQTTCRRSGYSRGLSQRLAELSRIDVKSMPDDRVGFGSKVTIVDLELDEESTLTLVAGDFMDLDGGQVSMASPIGSGLLGARAQEEVTIELPRGERRFFVKEVLTLPQQLGLAETE